jgi:uncharacterized protein YndB with AHSA1/START domain
MNKAILLTFQVDKEKNQIKVERTFSAPIDLVWAAWTEADILDQWWAPKPWRAETKHMDFREGGYWLYAMVGPQNEKLWSRADYEKIITEKFFSAYDGFCDEEGNLNLPCPETNGKTGLPQRAVKHSFKSCLVLTRWKI